MRNLALFVGLVLVVETPLISTALFVLSTFCAVAWVLGAAGIGVPAAAWALPLRPASDVVVSVAAVSVFIVGAARFVLIGHRDATVVD